MKRLGLALALVVGFGTGYVLTVPGAAADVTTYEICFCRYGAIDWHTLTDVDGCPEWDPHIPSKERLAQEICVE